jgi:hypothetical protein
LKLSLASMLVLALMLAAAPAVLAAETAKPAAPPAAPTAPDKAGAADSSNADSGSTDTPPAEAPVPDPFLAEAYKACRDGASGDKGTFQRLQDAGWNLTVDGDTQTPFYQAFNGEKDFDGVGTVDITYSLEVYPSMTEGYCSLSIDTANRKIGIADLGKMPELKGEVRVGADGVASNWQDNVASPITFIQADQHTKDLYFLLDVTTLMKKPAADIPHVAPAPDDSTDANSAD